MNTLVVIPAYNEQDSIVSTVTALRAAGSWDYLVVNDGSDDGTAKILDRLALNHLDLPVNLGIGAAVQTGFEYARRHGYQYAVQLDADGQHDPRSIPSLLEPVMRGECDMAIGSRFSTAGGYRGSLVRRLGIRYFQLLVGLLTGIRVTDPTSGFRAVNRALIELFAEQYPNDYPEPEVLIALAKKGLRVTEVPVAMKPRQGGRSSIRPWDSVYYMTQVSVTLLLRRFG